MRKTRTQGTGKKRGPAPRGPFEDKRKTLTTRITEETREQLEQAAEGAGRSLSQEIEMRLQQSLRDDDDAGGAHLRSFMRFVGAATSLIEEHTGKTIFDDHETAMMARRAWDRILAYMGAKAPQWVVETINDMNNFLSEPEPEPPQRPSHKDGKPIVNWLAYMASPDGKLFAEQMETVERKLSEREARRQELNARAERLDRYFKQIANIGDSIFAPEKQ